MSAIPEPGSLELPPVDLVTLNPGIRRVVALLRANRFNTCDSGDGETHQHECDRATGYVAIYADRFRLVEEADRLVRLLGAYGVSVDSIGNGHTASIQASYDPVNGIAIIDVSDIHDRMLNVPNGTGGVT